MSALENEKAAEIPAGGPGDLPPSDRSSQDATRRNFVASLAKLAIVPAVVAGVAANMDPAFAR